MTKHGIWILLAIIFVAFAGTLESFFVQDDFWYLDKVLKPMPNEHMLLGSLDAYLRPLSTYWFPSLLYYTVGLNASAQHMVLMVVFLATCYTLFHYLRVVTKHDYAPYVGTALYGLALTHAWTLGWIAGATDILTMLFMVVGLYIYESRDNKWLALPWFILMMFSKEPWLVATVAFTVSLFLAKRGEWKWWGIASVGYLVLWVSVRGLETSGSMLPIDLERILTILRYGIFSITIYGVPSPFWELAYVGVIFAGLFLLHGTDKLRPFIFVMLTCFMSTISFGLFKTMPPALEGQIYYGHLCMFGLACAIALICSQIRSKWLWGVVIVLMLVWAWHAVKTDRQFIDERIPPPMLQSALSEYLYDSVRSQLKVEDKLVVLVNLDQLTEFSIDGGKMIPIMFDGLPCEVTSWEMGDEVPDYWLDDDTCVIMSSEFHYKRIGD